MNEECTVSYLREGKQKSGVEVLSKTVVRMHMAVVTCIIKYSKNKTDNNALNNVTPPGTTSSIGTWAGEQKLTNKGQNSTIIRACDSYRSASQCRVRTQTLHKRRISSESGLS